MAIFLSLTRRATVTLSVGPRGNPTDSNSLTDKIGYVYDPQGRLFQVRQPVDGQWQVVKENHYGDDNQVSEVKVPDPVSDSGALVTGMKYTYTGRKELKSAKNANNMGTTYSYLDLLGQVETVSDALNHLTHYTYHSTTQRLNQIKEAWLTNNERSTTHTWQNGLLATKTGWNPQAESDSSTWNYYYDHAGRIERMEPPQGAAEVYRYNEFSERDQTTIGQKVITSLFNGLGQEAARTTSGAFSSSISISYDGGGNVSQIDDGTLRKDISWDVPKGVADSESLYVNGSLWRTIDHQYDVGGNHTKMIYPDPTTTEHEWVRDDANRITGIRVGGFEVCSMAYTKGGLLRLTVIRNASGAAIAETIHDYDGLGRHIRAHTVRLPNQATLSDLHWEYDDLGRITKIRYEHLGTKSEIGYNERNEVTSEEITGNASGMAAPPYDNTYGSLPTGNESNPSDEVMATPAALLSVPNRAASYVYDNAGNRLSQTIDGVTTTYTYSAGNRLITESRSGYSVIHAYDEWGNEVERTTTVSGTETVENYGYNAQNLMSTYVRSVGATIQANWQYDFWPSGERYGKSNLLTGIGQIYAVSGENVVADYSVTSGGIALQNTYGQGLGVDQKSLRIPQNGNSIHYLGDAVGTVSMTLTDAGSPSETCLRDIFGLAIAGGIDDDRYGFCQREHDTESGLVYMRHRMYDSRVGRFTQTDPLFASRSSQHYLYAGNSPAMNTDPLGLFPMSQLFARIGEDIAIQLMQEAGWVLLGRAAKLNSPGPDAIMYNVKEKMLRIVDNKAYTTARTLGQDATKVLTTRFAQSQELAKQAILKSTLLSRAEQQAALSALENGVVQRVITPCMGAELKLSGALLKQDVIYLSQKALEAEAAAETAAVRQAAGAASRAAWARWAARGVSGALSVATVASFVIFNGMETAADDYTPEQLAQQHLVSIITRAGGIISPARGGDEGELQTKGMPITTLANICTEIQLYKGLTPEARDAIAEDIQRDWVDNNCPKRK